MGCSNSKSLEGDDQGLLAHSPSDHNGPNRSQFKAAPETAHHQQQHPSSATSYNQQHNSNHNNHAPPPQAAPPHLNQPQRYPPNQAPAPPVKKLPSTATPVNRAQDRYDAIDATKKLVSDGVTLRYAYLSQRGHYPDDPFKANQDAYCVDESITTGVNDAFFGVFDGHGATGDLCAIYAKQHLPQQVRHFIAQARKSQGSNGEVPKEAVQSALVHAHVETNRGLHRNTTIDDSLSGTTAISMFMHGKRNRITICNVGDSRCIIGQEQSGPGGKKSLKAFPLSRDQTPYRKDERKRIRATGARILSLDQLEGLEPIVDASENEDFELGEELDEGGDPPRVWHPTGDYPGTAFTRSIGDAMAEELGVFAEPEMLTREILPEDKILILASDGVFEFLTNQSVVDICAKFADPLEACRAVVAEAYELWLQYELRTDDITIICMFIDRVVGEHAPGQSSEFGRPSTSNQPVHVSDTGEDVSESDEGALDNAVMSDQGLKPVRKNVSKEKSKEIQKLKELGKRTLHAQETEDADFDWKKHATKKTKDEKEGIADAIKASIMFRNINDEQREMIYSCMESVKVRAGDWVIRQGTVGDRFYIIDEGRFEVRIVPDGEEDLTGEGGHIVHVYEGSRARHAHPAFGELALMYSAPRSASIVAQTDGHLWALHRAAFRQVLIHAQDHRKELKKTLGEIPYFQYLDSDGINKLAAIMDEITFGRGESLCQQGQVGDTMFVIASGSCYSVRVNSKGEHKRGNIKAGQYFGDEIFSGKGKYLQTVVAGQTTTCWQLDANLLKQTMGPLLQGGK